MEYHTYQELVDRINYLLKENRELNYMFYCLPLQTIRDMIGTPGIDFNMKMRWIKLYEKKYKFLQRINDGNGETSNATTDN